MVGPQKAVHDAGKQHKQRREHGSMLVNVMFASWGFLQWLELN